MPLSLPLSLILPPVVPSLLRLTTLEADEWMEILDWKLVRELVHINNGMSGVWGSLVSL